MEIGAVSAFLFKQCHYHIFQHDPAAAGCCSGRLCICPVQIPGEDDPVWDYDDDAHDTGTVDLYAAVFDLFQDGTDYFWPLVMTTNDKVRTLSIGVSMLKNTEGGASWNVLMAGNVILVLPILIVFVCAQRQIIRAFTYTGEK